jgi:predicted nucleic acid-binding protein
MAEGMLVDTNVLLDLVTDDEVWAAWSIGQLDAASLRGALLINGIVYAELSVRFARIEDLDLFVDEASLEVARIPRAALFLGAKAFQRYKAAGGPRAGVLPDFLIGAHAAVAALPLLTRDVARYRRYFPTVTLISPEV